MKKLLLFLFIFLILQQFCHWQTGGFALHKMLTSPDPTATATFPYKTLTYLATGKQFYVFETPDHQYVVKFLKFSRRRPLPFSFLKKANTIRAHRLQVLEQSIHLAIEHLSDSTGLIPTAPCQNTITLIDKLGIRHTISLANTRFIVQKKATPFAFYFAQHPSQAHQLIDSTISTIISQCQKRIRNSDLMLERNFGFDKGHLLLLDTGSLSYDLRLKNPAHLKQEIFLEILPLRQFLQQHYPEHLIYFDEALQNHLFNSEKDSD